MRGQGASPDGQFVTTVMRDDPGSPAGTIDEKPLSVRRDVVASCPGH